MVQKLKEKDFVEIDYTGRLKNEDYIFDTTNESVAKQSGLYNPGVRYGSVITCVGKGLILPALDNALLDKEIGKEYTIDVNSGEAFGKRSAKMLKLVPASVFKKQGIHPQIGLQVTFDNSMGIIKTISGGRVIVDFNHPLAGKELSYKVNIKKLITDKKEQIKSVLELKLNIKKEEIFIELDENNNSAMISLNIELPNEALEPIINFIKDCVDVKELSFKKSKTIDDKDKNFSIKKDSN